MGVVRFIHSTSINKFKLIVYRKEQSKKKYNIQTDLGLSVHNHRNYVPMVMMNYPFVQALSTFFMSGLILIYTH